MLRSLQSKALFVSPTIACVFSSPVVRSLFFLFFFFFVAGGAVVAKQVVFEEFGFAACYRCPSAALSCYHEQVLEEERESM